MQFSTATVWVLALAALPAAGGDCVDLDADGFQAPAGCGSSVDCNDADAAVHPAAPDGCNGIDDDCDGLVDGDCETVCELPGTVTPFAELEDHESSCLSPNLAWNGQEFAIAFEDDRDFDWSRWEIYFGRIDRLGNLLAPPHRLTFTNGTSRLAAANALRWGAGTYALVITHPQPVLMILDPAGAPIHTEPIPGTAPSNPTWNGQGFAVAYQAPAAGVPQIWLARFDGRGNPVGAPTQVSAHTAEYVIHAMTSVWNGTGYLVAWSRTLTGGPTESVAVPVDANGVPGAPQSIGSRTVVSLASGGTNHQCSVSRAIPGRHDSRSGPRRRAVGHPQGIPQPGNGVSYRRRVPDLHTRGVAPDVPASNR
jgi:hypothetical protein